MNVGQYQYVEQWNDESDLLALPTAEDDQHEYKSSLTPDTALAEKISIAASAFWNTGRGVFVAGVDGTGKVDGGISSHVGRQSRRDWTDQAVMKTQPAGPYIVCWIEKGTSINANCGVLVIAFGDSNTAHMAYDYRYRIRLGAHSEVANHYLVEAIRARKSTQIPVIRARLERSERKARVIVLAIYVLDDAIALNVSITFNPMPQTIGKYFREKLPLRIPVIRREQPFTMELYYWGARNKTFGTDALDLVIEFEDLLGQQHYFTQQIDPDRGIDPMTLDITDADKIIKILKTISFQLGNLNELARAFLPVTDDNSDDSDDPLEHFLEP
jgi:hypothetical protein